MGYDLVAHLDVDQEVLASLVSATPRRPSESDYDWNRRLTEAFRVAHAPGLSSYGLSFLMYSYDEASGMHELRVFRGVNGVRDDPRLKNKWLPEQRAEKMGVNLPLCFMPPPWGIHDRKDALETAAVLEALFPDKDDNLWHFARWLRETAEYCDHYELST